MFSRRTAYDIVENGTPDQLRKNLKKYKKYINERQTQSDVGTTALMRAAFKGNAEIVENS